MDYLEFEKTLRMEMAKKLKPSRIEHSKSVARLSEHLCRRFGLDSRKGLISGLAHDLCKGMPTARQWGLCQCARDHGNLAYIDELVGGMRGEPGFRDKIVHGPAAAVYLYVEMGIREMDIIEAVALHSSASASMGPLAKILYIADKLEPSRAYHSAADSRATETLDLDALLLYTVTNIIGWLSEEGYGIARGTLDLYNELKTGKAAS